MVRRRRRRRRRQRGRLLFEPPTSTRRLRKWITRAKLGLSPAGAHVSPRRDPLYVHQRCSTGDASPRARGISPGKKSPKLRPPYVFSTYIYIYTDPPHPQSRLPSSIGHRDHPQTRITRLRSLTSNTSRELSRSLAERIRLATARYRICHSGIVRIDLSAARDNSVRT